MNSANHDKRGCDWFVAGNRCDRTDLALSGDGSHVCTVHVAAWLEVSRNARMDLAEQRLDALRDRELQGART